MQALFFYLDAVWLVLLALAPWLFLGTLIAAVLHVWLPPEFIRTQLSGRFAVLKAVAVGVPLPLCSCGVIPAGLSLKEGGASRGASVGFLISTPQTGVDSVLVSASFLGWPFALYKVISAVLLGWVGGVLTDGFGEPERAAEPGRSEDKPAGRSWRDGTAHGIKLLRTIWRWLLFGVLVSAALSAFVPPGSLAAFGSEWTAMVLVLCLSVPLYVCATASVPIAASLVTAGMPVGAALVFLMAGPATNVATLGAVYRAFGRRTLLVYLATLVIGSLGLGWLIGAVADPEMWAVGMHEHDRASPVEIVSAALLVALLGWFAVQEFAAWIRRPALDSGASPAATPQVHHCSACDESASDATAS